MDVAEGPATIVFARHPTPGKVKTRLARTVGDSAAASFYRQCAELLIGIAARTTGSACYLFYSSGEEQEAIRRWLDPLQLGLRYRQQLQADDLGDRMQHALQQVQSAGHSRVLLIGTDVPDLSATVLHGAVAALGSYQAVFGPAEDGGYYLVGLGAPLPAAFFRGVTWSTETVLEQNLKNAELLGVRVAPLETLPTLPDIDTREDLRRWLARRRQQQQAEGGPEHPLAAVAAELVRSVDPH